jgi:hypothetical protein
LRSRASVVNRASRHSRTPSGRVHGGRIGTAPAAVAARTPSSNHSSALRPSVWTSRKTIVTAATSVPLRKTCALPARPGGSCAHVLSTATVKPEEPATAEPAARSQAKIDEAICIEGFSSIYRPLAAADLRRAANVNGAAA